MAASKALDIPELLEAILLELSMKDLLFAQKVSKGWKHTFDDSARLQKALFLTAGDRAAEAASGSVLASTTSDTVALNPLLLGPTVFCETMMNRSAPNADRRGSCHQMFIVQPPAKVQVAFYRRDGAWRWLLHVVDVAAGARFGEVVAKLDASGRLGANGQGYMMWIR